MYQTKKALFRQAQFPFYRITRQKGYTNSLVNSTFGFSKICVKRICVNQGVGLLFRQIGYLGSPGSLKRKQCVRQS